MVLDFFLGISQNHDADSIPLLQSVALYLWCALTVYVASQTGTLPRESPGLQNCRRWLPNCKAETVKSRPKRFKRDRCVQKICHFASFSAFFYLLKATSEVKTNYWQCPPFLSWSLCFNVRLPNFVFFFFFGRPLRNSEWKFDSNVCWLHYKQRTVIFA